MFRTMLVLETGLVGLLAVALVAAWRMRRARDAALAAIAVLTRTLAQRDAALATTAHEIRTPLNGILGMTQLLLANWRVDGDVRDQVKVMHGAGEAMLTLVNDILDAAKMTNGEIATVREDVRLAAMLRDLSRLWAGRAEAKGVRLALELAEAPDAIRSDEARLRQIVGNLLSNAIKFTEHGAVTLRAFADGETVVVEVRDSGIGIAAAELPRVFEAFHQVGSTAGGTGLGLSISRGLAEALGGSLDVASKIGSGSTFTLRLPLVAVEALAFRPQPTSLAQVRMLLVEANPLTQGLFRGLIEPSVERFDCVADARGAVAALEDGGVDHVLADARSAGIEGLAALIDAARERCVPVTVLVSPSDGIALDAIEALDPTQLIVKPVAGAALVAMLRDAWVIEVAA